MRTVIYTEDMLPITVVDIHSDLIRMMQSGRPIMLQAHEPLKFVAPNEPVDWTRKIELKRVMLYMEPLYRKGGHRSWLCFTKDEESALILQAAFLPGQLSEVRRREEASYWEGMFQGFMM